MTEKTGGESDLPELGVGMGAVTKPVRPIAPGEYEAAAQRNKEATQGNLGNIFAESRPLVSAKKDSSRHPWINRLLRLVGRDSTA